MPHPSNSRTPASISSSPTSVCTIFPRKKDAIRPAGKSSAYAIRVEQVALPLYPQWGTEPNGFYIPPRHSPRGYARQMFGPGVDNAIEKYLVPSRELLAVLQLWRASQQIVFRYDVIPGPKVFETQIHGKRFEMYNDTVLGFNKSGKEVARIQVEEPIYIRPAERVTWL